ncbi:hypothetical protein VHUM_03000 [Vanrija humicola]|uniref:Peptidase M24 domain-containing protein n=1 Tax=Vanrija humicola TaxID=5417 RepID=A0A7D8V061_VANHU|nr:hypothetical protein VHUM_03000 [Vanrija humicola]
MVFGPAGADDAHSLPATAAAVPPLDAAFVRDCEARLTPPEDTHTARLERLAAALGSDRLAYIAEPGPSAAYFLGGFAGSQWKASERPFLVAVTASGDGPKVTLLTPAFEESRARLIALPAAVGAVATFVPWAESASPYATLLAALGVDGFVLDAQVREFVAAGLRSAAGVRVDALALAAASERVRRIRQVKDAHEVALMRCANVFTLHAIRRTRAQLRFGVSESETRAILYKEMGDLGLKENGALILFGENAALPHGSGTDRKLGPQDLVLIDAGGKWGGYVADITRTFALPESDIPAAHKRVWELVRHAQAAPAALLERSASTLHFRQLDHQARALISHGMRRYGVSPAPAPDYTVFTHRLGHGIGLEGHEAPYVVQGPLGEETVVPGNVFTLEPGVYVPADAEVGDDSVRGLGVRLEDVFVVHEAEGKLAGEWLTGPVSEWGDV